MTTESSGLHRQKGLLERKIDSLSSTLYSYINAQLLASSLLFFCIFIAIIMSNIEAVNGYYQSVINLRFGFHLDEYIFNTSLHSFVNHGLLTLFFFVLGLEIKREFAIGELSNLPKSLYVILCSLGGALFPALLYLMINYHHPDTIHGWAIPMATDTALSIGVLYLFKNKIPSKMFTLVASLAVIDDMLSIVIIAIAYSSHFNLIALLTAVVVLLCLIITNLCGFRHPLFYLILGIVEWICIDKAGIHSTIAGVFVALCIPARPKRNPKKAVKTIRSLLRRFDKEYDDKKHLLADINPHQTLEAVTLASYEATTPLKRWENRLEMPVLVGILPLFALTNGGFTFNFSQLSMTLASPLFWGIFLGLVVAKPVGVLFFSWAIQQLKIAKPPTGITHQDIIIVGFLAGIGYTMSIFIAALSFSSQTLSDMAKLSIFISSITTSLIAITLLKRRAPC